MDVPIARLDGGYHDHRTPETLLRPMVILVNPDAPMKSLTLAACRNAATLALLLLPACTTTRQFTLPPNREEAIQVIAAADKGGILAARIRRPSPPAMDSSSVLPANPPQSANPGVQRAARAAAARSRTFTAGEVPTWTDVRDEIVQRLPPDPGSAPESASSFLERQPWDQVSGILVEQTSGGDLGQTIGIAMLGVAVGAIAGNLIASSHKPDPCEGHVFDVIGCSAGTAMAEQTRLASSTVLGALLGGIAGGITGASVTVRLRMMWTRTEVAAGDR